MESSTSAMLTRLKQRAVNEFLTAEKVNASDDHRYLKPMIVTFIAV